MKRILMLVTILMSVFMLSACEPYFPYYGGYGEYSDHGNGRYDGYGGGYGEHENGGHEGDD
ncbi:MAG: hypothetical protein Q9M82_01275 [Mariprofundus sp.]|nr:hypothetical protein [Mariprofundus sp.]